MTLKRKLTLGLGFLFLLIFGLGIFYSYNIGRLSQDAENILKDNYKSLVFSKNMLSALEDMRTAVSRRAFDPAVGPEVSDYSRKLFEAGRTAFDENLRAEKGNVTEIQEKEYVDAVERGYDLYALAGRRILQGGDGRALFFSEFQPVSENLRQAVNSIHDINMQAVERKSGAAKSDADRIIALSAAIGVVGIILAFGYFWYFPFYLSSTIAYLADRMRTLLKRSGVNADIQTDDETFAILQAINLLESKLDPKPDGDTKD